MFQRTAEIGRFLAAGVSTTAVSYALYLGLIYLSVPYLAAYPISFIVGIVWSYVVNSAFVFRHKPTLRGLLAFPLVYALQLLVGLLVVYLAVATLGLPEWIAPLIAIAATLPMTYLLSRWLIRKTSARSHPG